VRYASSAYQEHTFWMKLAKKAHDYVIVTNAPIRAIVVLSGWITVMIVMMILSMDINNALHGS